jgi:hypothetical protein
MNRTKELKKRKHELLQGAGKKHSQAKAMTGVPVDLLLPRLLIPDDSLQTSSHRSDRNNNHG